MKLSTLVLATTLALALGGCAMHRDRHGGHGPMGPRYFDTQPDPQQPRVDFRGGRIVIDQDVLKFPRGKRDITITWRLPKDGKLRFPRNGIQFERQADGEIVDCRPIDEGLAYSCLNRNTRRDHYKYDVRLLVDGKEVAPLDPYVLND